MSEGFQKSVEARGLAAHARDAGMANNAPGFQRGGENRQQANAIVHAPVGDARNHVGTARDLNQRANK
jgi:hypothetical protein